MFMKVCVLEEGGIGKQEVHAEGKASAKCRGINSKDIYINCEERCGSWGETMEMFCKIKLEM